MGTTLTGKRVQNTYDSLLKLSDNDNLTGVAKIVGDGFGNNSPIYLSTTQVGIGVTPSFEFHTNSHAKIGGNLIVGGNLTVDGTTTIVDSTVVAIGDNMIELAKDNVANVKDIGWYGTINSSGEKYVGMFYDASDGITVPTFRIGLGTSEPGSTMTITTKGKLVIGALDASTGVFSGQVTIPVTPSANAHAASKKYVDDSVSGTVDGSGTANDVAMWSDSDTLTDAPIAISGNNSTFAGNVDVTGSLNVDSHIEVQSASGYGYMEIGGPSGGHIDLKKPFSDDYDLRLITDTDSQITASGTLKLNAGNNLTLTLDGSTQDATFTGNINATKASGNHKINPTTGQARFTIESPSANGNNVYLGLKGPDTEWRWITNRGDLNGGNQGDLFLREDTEGVNVLTFETNNGNATFNSSVTASSFIKSGGTSSQFLMADGSVSTGTGIDGSGTANDIVMWQDSDTLTDAPIAISGNNATFAGNVELKSDAGNATRFLRIHNQGTAANDDAVLSWTAQASRTYSMGIHRDSGNLVITNADASVASGDIININNSGNATFAGSVGVAGSSIVEKLNTPNIKVSGSTITGTVSANTLFIDNLSSTSRFFSCGADASTNGTFNFNTGTSAALGATMLTLASTGATFAGNIATAADKRIAIGTWDNSAFTGGAAHGYYVSAGTPLLILEESDQSKTGYVGVSGGNMFIGGVVSNLNLQTNNGTTALTIDSSQNATFVGTINIAGDYKVDGNILIGTTSTYTIIRNPEETSAIFLGDSADPSNYYDNNQHYWRASGGGSIKMALVSSTGNLGIGTTSPASPLQVVATGIGSNGTIGIQGANAHLGFKNSSGTFRSWVGHFNAAGHGSDADLNLKTGYGSVGNIRFTADGDTTAAQMFLQGSTGNLGIGTTSPENILTLQAAAGSMHQRFKESSTTIGFIGGANGIISGHNGKLALRAESGLVLSSQGNSPDVVISSGNSTFAGNVHLTDEKILAFRSTNDYAIQYRDLDFRFIGSADGTTNRFFSFGHYTSDNPAGTWNGKVYINSFTGNVGIGTASPDGNLEVIASTVVSGASDSVNNVLMGLQAANRPTIILDTADTTYTNRTWNITNVGSAGSLFFGRNGLDVLVMKNDGNVGIGTTSPSKKLHVYNTAAADVALLESTQVFSTLAFKSSTNTDTAVFGIDGGGNAYIENKKSTHPILFTTNSNERMRIHSDGNVTIGNTASVQPLTVAGNVLIRTTTADSFENRFQFIVGGSGDAGNFYVYNAAETPTVRLNGGGESYFNGGAVLIGQTTTVSDHKLTVNGKIGGPLFSSSFLQFSGGHTLIKANDDVKLGFNQNVIVKQSGRVGIGTTSPAVPLHIAHGSSSVALYTFGGFNHQAKFESSDAEAAIIIQDSNSTNNGNRIGVITNDMTFITNDSEKMRIKSNGKVGIGTANAQNAELAIKSGSNVDLELFSEASGTAWQSFNRTTSAWGYLRFLAGGGEQMRVHTNGNVGIGTTSPSSSLTIATKASVGTIELLATNAATMKNKIIFSEAILGDESFFIEHDGAGAGANNLLKIHGDGSGGTASGITIRRDGRIGIGTDSPSSKLVVRTSTDHNFEVEETGGELRLSALNNARSANIGLQFAASEFNFLTGNVGIGTTSPTAKLEIVTAVGADAIRMNYGQSADIFLGFNSANPRILLQDNSNIITHDFTSNANNYIVGSNLGIGTTSPSAALDIKHGTAPLMTRSTNNNGLALFNEIDSGYSHLYLYQINAGARVVISTNGNSYFNGGNVGIGDTSPTSISANTSSLSVNSSRTDLTGGLISKANGTVKHQQYWDSTGYGFHLSASSGNFRWTVGNNTRMSLNSSGTLTVSDDIVAFGSPSDKRLKENIKPIESALDKVSKLQGVTFDWKKSDSILDIKQDVGFIAQDVQKVVPELVRQNDNGMLSIRHQGIAPILLEAIKELKAEIEELKKQI